MILYPFDLFLSCDIFKQIEGTIKVNDKNILFSYWMAKRSYEIFLYYLHLKMHLTSHLIVCEVWVAWNVFRWLSSKSHPHGKKVIQCKLSLNKQDWQHTVTCCTYRYTNWWRWRFHGFHVSLLTILEDKSIRVESISIELIQCGNLEPHSFSINTAQEHRT